jgi:hypothetical protein
VLDNEEKRETVSIADTLVAQPARLENHGLPILALDSDENCGGRNEPRMWSTA